MAETARRFRFEAGLYDEIYIAERIDTPGAWTVEALHRDGAIEQAIFAGPDSRGRAEAYLRSQYGEIIGARLDPPVGRAPPTVPD